MEEVEMNEKLVSACGFYCGNCKAFLKGKCTGCESNTTMWASKCKIKLCCQENNYLSCADCKAFEDVQACLKLNSTFDRFMGMLVGYSRVKNIKAIQKDGYTQYAAQRIEENSMWVKRK